MIELLHDSVDISNLVISYTRQQEMCTGIGILDVVLVDEGRAYFPWDVLELFEDGRKKGEYYIVEFDDDENSGVMSVSAQDGSKRLTDYFIDDQYEVSSTTTTRSLIITFLNQAGVSYSITDDEGEELGEGATFGMGSAYDTIVTLLQSSGWYMYFDPINTCIIGTLDTNPGSAKEITDATILYVKVHTDDNMLRNKAVVWGGSEYPSGGMVHVSKETITPWNYDENDLRAVVISNGNIREYGIANTMANKLMQEFARITIEKEINLAGTTTLTIGDYISVKSKWWMGSGLITTHSASFSAGDGLITNIILDQRCPRLFGFWKKYPLPPINGDEDEIFDYVYVGTAGAGVWRKGINRDTWETFSSGLENLSIIDLFVKDGTFACVAEDGYLYIRTEDAESWFKYSHGDLYLDEFFLLESEIAAVACSINESGIIICGYNYVGLEIGGETFAWVVGVTNTGSESFVDQVKYLPLVEEGEEPGELIENVSIFDLEAYSGNTNIVTTVGTPLGEGYRARQNIRFVTYPVSAGWGHHVGDDTNILSTLGKDGFYDSDDGDMFLEQVSALGDMFPLIDRFERELAFVFNFGTYCTCTTINLGDFTVADTHNFLLPPTFTGFQAIYQKSEDRFSIVTGKGVGGGKVEYYTIEYTIGDEHPNATYMGSVTSEHDKTLLGNTFIVRHGGVTDNPVQTPDHYTPINRIWTYNLDSFSGFSYISNTEAEKWITDPSGIDHLVDTIAGTITVMIPGADSATFLTLYAKITDWTWVWGGIFGWWSRENEYVMTSQCFIATKNSSNQNVSISMGGEIPLEYYHAQNYRLFLFSADSVLTAGGGSLIQFRFDDVIDMSPYDAERVMRIYGFDQRGQRVYALMPSPGVPLTQEQNLESGIYNHIGTSGKFYTPNWVSAVPYPNPTHIWIRDFNNSVTKFPMDTNISTPFGTTIMFEGLVWGYRAYTFDDADGTLYMLVEDTTHSASAIIGIRNGSIVKEFIPRMNIGTPMLLRDYIAYSSGGTWYLIRGFPGGDPSSTLKHTVGGTFEVIHNPGLSAKVEISKGSPIEVYHEVETLATNSAFIYQNPSTSIDGWSEITTEVPVHDLRVFDIIDSSVFTVASGDVGTENRWVGVATTDGVKAFPVSLAGESIMIAEFANPVTHLETTNFNGNPYFFVTTSGIDGSGAGFYQRGQNETSFLEYSSGLPSEHVTIIRVDDRI